MAGPIVSPILPPLREELHLYQGPRAWDGSPTKTIWDPQTNNYFRIGWSEFEILSRWQLGSVEAIAAAVSSQTILDVKPEHVEVLSEFLIQNSLLRPPESRSIARFKEQTTSRKHWLTRTFHSYLFFRIPLFNPDRFLLKTLPGVRWLFSSIFLGCMVVAALLGLFLVSQKWEIFLADAYNLTSMSGLVLLGFALVLTKLIHELGHAYSARHFGCHVPTIGVALLMMWPLLYTDTSDTWRLPSRRQRLIVGAAGLLAESILAAVALLAWGLLPAGDLRSVAFFVAAISLISTILLNLSPLLRLDGYYLFSDWLEVENLHDRAANLGRWYLREMLFGFGYPPPEPALADRRGFLIFFAYLTWIYRFVLLIGISLLVYFFFFKFLGIILMGVEIGWFILLPISNELRAWRGDAVKLSWNAHTLGLSLFMLGLMLFFVVPFNSSIEAPALLHRDGHTVLYAPLAAQVTSFEVAQGDEVAKGELLIQLDSPESSHRITQSRLQKELSKWQLVSGDINPDLAEQQQIIAQEYAADLSQYRGYVAQKAKLRITAPFAGKIVAVNQQLQVGEWVSENSPLLEITHPHKWRLVAYVKDIELNHILPAANATFYPEGSEWSPIKCKVTQIAKVHSAFLEEPSLTAIHGGDIAAQLDRDGRLVPNRSLYRIQLSTTANMTTPRHKLRGKVVIEGEQANLVSKIWRTIVGVLIRESGF